MSESTDEESPPLCCRHRDPYAMEMGVLDSNHFSSKGRTGTSDIKSASSNPQHSPVLQLDRQDLLGGAAEGELQALNHLPLEPLLHHGNSNHMPPSGSGNLMPQAVSNIRTSASSTLDSQTASAPVSVCVYMSSLWWLCDSLQIEYYYYCCNDWLIFLVFSPLILLFILCNDDACFNLVLG